MNEIGMALGAALAGFCIAWYLRGWRAHAQFVPVRARLESLERQYTECVAQLDALRSDRERVAGLYRAEVGEPDKGAHMSARTTRSSRRPGGVVAGVEPTSPCRYAANSHARSYLRRQDALSVKTTPRTLTGLPGIILNRMSAGGYTTFAHSHF